jgi:hypothetical protein
LSSQSWKASLTSIRAHPTMVTGNPLLLPPSDPIVSSLRAIFEKKLFGEPFHGTVDLSPTQYCIRCEAGSLHTELAAGIDWQTCDNLLYELPRSLSEGGIQDGHLKHALSDPTFHWSCFTLPLHLADRGVLAVRVAGTLWCQTFQNGWPVVPPFTVEGNQSLSLLIAAALTPEYYPTLPFTLEAAQTSLPPAARGHVTLQWHPEEELLPRCPTHPNCLLKPQLLQRWL